MDTLDHYLTEEHPSEQRDIDEIEKYLERVLPIYIKEFNDNLAWPYEIWADKATQWPKDLSHNTTAMILSALLRLAGKFKSDPFKANIFPRDTDPNIDVIEAKITQASKSLLEAIMSTYAETDTNTTSKKRKKFNIKSGTFGDNDVFSLAWLAEISTADWEEPHSQDWKQLQKLILEEAQNKLNLSKNFQEPEALFKPKKGQSTHATALALPHAFPALRLVQIIRLIEKSKNDHIADYYGYFETILHQQLSFSSIPDSRFDPAELMFCLEGMLLCQKNFVDRTLFDRVLTVLTSRQIESPYWRPVKPYLATPQGLVLFPVSVEIANSLLRACDIFDGDEMRDTYSSRCIDLFRRYWQWLRARAVKFPPKQAASIQDTDYVGWHSEHVNEPTVIHLWETSQVIEFLLAYRNTLHSHVARTTLIRSRFTYKNFKQDGKPWKEKEDKFETVTTLGEKLCIYKRIGQDFVKPHSDKKPENFSMLLYGPPGTGKTTVAESIAEVLGYRLITITVSDFLAEGGAQVEARAKNIFDALKAQPSCIVLFDEIDHFLLDRDSERYSEQETVFQFMTPGMLTKN